MADVNIKIDIDADTSAIDRVRAKLRTLCKEVDDCTATMDKHTKSLRDLSDAQDEAGRGAGRNTNHYGKTGRAARSLTGFLGKLAKFGFLYVAIEAAAALAVIGSAAILFKSGQLLARGYQMALSGVAYGFAAIVAAGSAALAAMRQFQAVQFAPSFSEGTINTTDPMRTSSAAMKMFIDDTEMAVIGTKGLTAAFKTLNDQQQITGETTAVFRQLSNYTAGMGGDMEKGSQAMAKFLAQFQKDKRMTEAVKEAGKELGPGFEKILNEANKLGLTTYEKFTKAALEGELGDTFKKYAGQLDAVNSTVIGQFKQGFGTLKNLLVEVGEPLLGPLTKQIPRVVRILESLIINIRSNVQAIGEGSLLEGMVSAFEKISLWIGKIVNRDIRNAGSVIDGIVNGWNSMMGFFERIQDYLRPLVDAGYVLGRIFKEIFSAFGTNLNNTIQSFSNSLVENEKKWMGFASAIGNFISAIGVFGAMIKDVLGRAIPTLSDSLNIISEVIKAATPVFGVLLSLLQPILWTINLVLKAILGMADAIDSVLSPIISTMTLGFVNMTGVVKGLTSAVILLGVALMAINLKSKPGGKGKAISGKLLDIGGKGIKGGAKAGGRGVMSLGRGALSMGGKIAGKFGATGGAAAGGAAATTAATLGTLGIVAGSGIAGSKVGGFVSDKLFNDDSVMSKTGGAAAGAVSGGATGAAIGAGVGALFGGIGAAPGAAIGAVAGAIFGGISGWVSAGKEKKEARKVASEILKSYQLGMDDAIAKGDIEGIQKSTTDALIAVQTQLDKGGFSASEMKKKQKEFEVLAKQASTAVDNFSNFQAIFGDPDKLNEELKKQGKSADLVKNEIIDIFALMRQGGHDVAATWDGVMSEFNQKLIDARLAMFDLPLKTIEMQEKVNAAQQRVLQGDTSDKSIISFLKDAYTYSMDLAQGDVTKATVHFQKTIEKVSGPGGSMNKVADKLKEQTDALQLFDPKVFADQLITTGQTEVQGRALAALTGGDSALATLELNRRIMTGGAEEADRINEIIRLGTTGALTGAQIANAFGSDSATFTEILNTGRARQIQMDNDRRRSGEQGVPAANTRALNIGGVTVSVAGFISDPKVAQKIAEMVASEVAKRQQRSGTAPVSPDAAERRAGRR